MRMAGKELRELNWLYDLAYNVVNNTNKEYTDNAYKYVKQKLDELTKYKRAFEILNDKLWIKVQELREWEKEEYKKEYELITHSTQRFITKK